MPTLGAALAVCAGASLGALLRWGLSVQFNPLFARLPLGTLAANMIGGYLVGIALACFAAWPGAPLALRLFVVTGFLGGLTTFSTFSAEVITLFQQGRPGWAVTTAVTHLGASLLLTLLGVATVAWWRGSGT